MLSGNHRDQLITCISNKVPALNRINIDESYTSS